MALKAVKLIWLIGFLSLFGAAAATFTAEKSDFVIAIDIGHSPEQAGALSARGVGEYTFNKNIALLLQNRLLAAGFEKTFIATESNPEMGLESRASLANAKRADLLLSIHHDSVQPHYLSTWFYNDESYTYSDRFSGYSLFFSGKNPAAKQSLLFANYLGEELRQGRFIPTLHHAEKIDGENRPLIDAEKGIYQFDDLIILKNTAMPAVLIECGVIVNRQEELRLNDADRQQLFIKAIVRAVSRYAKEKP